MIPNFAAHCEGFQRVWHTSGGCWDYSHYSHRPTFAFVRWKSYFGFTCLWLALPWICDTGFAGKNTIWQSCCTQFIIMAIRKYQYVGHLIENYLCVCHSHKQDVFCLLGQGLPQNSVASSAKGLIVKTMSWLLKILIIFV